MGCLPSKPVDNQSSGKKKIKISKVSPEPLRTADETPKDSDEQTVSQLHKNPAITHSNKSLEKTPLPNIAAKTSVKDLQSDPQITSPTEEQKQKPTTFEIPLDETIKTKSRKPQSANPKNRANRKGVLQPVNISPEELQQKLRAAEENWQKSNPSVHLSDPSIPPPFSLQARSDDENLAIQLQEKEKRAQERREKELAMKQAKLEQHEMKVKQVQERKKKLEEEGLMNDQKTNTANEGIVKSNHEIPSSMGEDDLKISWGGEGEKELVNDDDQQKL
ncbi:hypothetical protein BKA69DRAFT_560973 [Paraphysoderma sedebokerense]|nr:hypothetical protein BKA69DRAFT_560973 [Paraphysoderma sedebokerense]